MNTINLHPHESTALAQRRLGMLIRIVEPQPAMHTFTKEPEPAFVKPQVPDGYIAVGVRAFNEGGVYGIVKGNPFVPGAVLGCREEWADWPGQRIVYKTDELPSGLKLKWRSARSMPAGAIRHRVIVGEVRCVRVQDLEESDIAKIVPTETGSGAIEGQTVYLMTTNSGYARGLHGARLAMKNLFNSTHGPGSWEKNPWLWLANIQLESK